MPESEPVTMATRRMSASYPVTSDATPPFRILKCAKGDISGLRLGRPRLTKEVLTNEGRWRVKTAREIMTGGVEIIDVGETVQEAASRMASQDIGAIPVCDGGRLHGMITDRDIAVSVVAAGLDPSTTTVGDVTKATEVVTIGADDTVQEALRTMKDHKVRRLPVIDGHTVIGMVSQGDIATSLPDGQVGDLVEAISAAP